MEKAFCHCYFGHNHCALSSARSQSSNCFLPLQRSTSSNIRLYDIIAVFPKTEKLFHVSTFWLLMPVLQQLMAPWTSLNACMGLLKQCRLPDQWTDWKVGRSCRRVTGLDMTAWPVDFNAFAPCFPLSVLLQERGEKTSFIYLFIWILSASSKIISWTV